MEISKQLSRNIYIMFSICFGGGNYLYITKYVDGDTFIGVCAFAVTCVFALMLYNVGTWFITYAFPALNSIIVSHRLKNEQPAALIKEYIPAIVVDEQTENDIPASDLISDVQIVRLKQIKESVVKDFIPFLSGANLDTLNGIIENYAYGKMPDKPLSLPLSELNGMTITDLFHFGWNMWFLLKPMNRRSTCRFLKKAFPNVLGEISEQTIYAKMTKDYGTYSIKLIEKEENIT